MDKITSINPEVLKWARKRSNITSDKIIQTMGDERYLLWENGNDFPTYVQLEKLMSLYNYPIAISFFSTLPDIEDNKVNFRTIPNEVIDSVDYLIIRLVNQAKAFQLYLDEIYQISGESPRNSLLTKSLDNQSMENLILIFKDKVLNMDLLKRKHKSSKEYFDYLRDSLFELGIYVFKDSFHNESVAGFCIYHEMYPVIYINNKVSLTRQLFTLFHELYHLIRRTNGIDFLFDDFLKNYKYDLTVEFECNSFAAKFLVPKEDLAKEVKSYGNDFDAIGKIANHFLVSRDVIARRMFDLGFLSYEDYFESKKIFEMDYVRVQHASDSKQKGDYYNTQMSYLGNKYLELVYREYYKKNITLLDLSRYTNLKYSSLVQVANRKNWQKV